MSPPSEPRLDLDRALRAVADRLDREEDRSWRQVTPNGECAPGRAEIVGDAWLTVSVPCASISPSPWFLLGVNAALDGCARAVCAPEGRLEVTGDIAVDVEAMPDSDGGGLAFLLDDRLARTYDDIVSAGRQMHRARPAHRRKSTPAPSDDAAQLVRLCDEAGWSARTLGKDRIAVTLDTGSADMQATLALEGGVSLRAWTALTTAPIESAESTEAVALLLLGSSRSFRAVKGVVVQQDGIELPGLALADGCGIPTAAAVHRALSALSVACGAVAREVLALQDATLARDYLTLRGRHGAGPALPMPVSHHEEDLPCLPLP